MTLKRTQAEVDERELRHVKLWRDDLAAMVSTIAEVASDIEMSADGYSFDDAEDLKQIKELRLHDFRLTASSGRIVLVLNRKKAAVIVKSPDLSTRGMSTELERLARGRRIHVRSYAQRIAFGALAAIVSVLMVIAAVNPATIGLTNAGPFESMAAVLVGGFLVFMFMGLMLSGLSPSGAVIFTRTQAEAPPWGRRNKDALVTNAIVSFVFLIIGLLIGYFLPK